MQKNEVKKFDKSGLKEKIFTIRGLQVMLDRNLAELYKVETKVLNQAVKRNKERFPQEFCFQMTILEFAKWKSQFVTSIGDKMGLRKIPYAFTEQGVAMLAGVLKSDIAIKISIKIIKEFVEMRKIISANAQIFQRLDRVEVKLVENDQKFDKVFSELESKELIPNKRIFFYGEIFDAYKFVSDIFRSAKKSILIIDNYIDNTVLVHLSDVKKNINVKILTKSISDKLKLNIDKFEKQYFSIEVKVFKLSHDRFIIIDEKDIYHFGASLKDLGKKWFAFSKFDKDAFRLMDKIKNIE
ncbi:MAG: ORF6N domain-containing protein [Candidatus Delongbacteria bacterium]|nr:ORF6N domain-containing protein [Candidatus Delongbacteria bacterium]